MTIVSGEIFNIRLYLFVFLSPISTLNQSDYDGRTALHIAVCEKKIDIIKFLVNVAKIKKDKKDRWGNTPLDECKNDPELINLFKKL